MTGVIADLWDLNDFWYHTVAGYAMGVFAAAHVLLNASAGRLRAVPLAVAAAPRPPAPVRCRSVAPAGGDVEPARPGRCSCAPSSSRRGLFGLEDRRRRRCCSAAGLRPAPQIAAGSDVGVIYHQWSKPGIIDALGHGRELGSAGRRCTRRIRGRRSSVAGAGPRRRAVDRDGDRRAPLDARLRRRRR